MINASDLEGHNPVTIHGQGLVALEEVELRPRSFDQRSQGVTAASRPSPGKLAQPTGALVVGGDYRALGIVRSLGRRGIPVWVVQDDHRLATFSKYNQKTLNLPKSGDEAQIRYLMDLGERHNLDGWMLFPTADTTVSLLAQHRDTLARVYEVTTPAWESLSWAHDKRLTHRFADAAGVCTARTLYPSGREQLESLDVDFPVILKPAVKLGADPFTKAKAWQANSPAELLALYDKAVKWVSPDVIMVQEVIPGGGDAQYSYAALCDEGLSLAGLTAKRMRQYPIDYGRFSTYVQTVDQPEVEFAAKQLLSAARYSGLVEVEFKYDYRDCRYKLFDVNPRVWGWHTLGVRAGLDFPYLLWLLMRGEPLPELPPCRPGLSWSYFAPDMLAAASQLRAGKLSLSGYFKSLAGRRESAILALDDPYPYAAAGLAHADCHVFGRLLKE